MPAKPKGDKSPDLTDQQAVTSPVLTDIAPTAAIHPVDLGAIRSELQGLHQEGNVLLNIPIWGWTGDGKTCSLLTAIHFCDPIQHPIEFALVRNPDDLDVLEQSVEEYSGLHLAAAAAATTQRLQQLSEGFIDRNEWPPGTDEPSSYVLAVRNISSTIGYVVFPDIKGGSFRELDETAREVIRKAHAAILLVNSELYRQPSTDGKRYRDEILERLQRFGRAHTPVCVMITKADLYRGPHPDTDATHKELSLILQAGDFKASSLVTRVSVIGDDCSMVANQLPGAAERHPHNLVAAFIWTVAAALKRPLVESRKLLPPVNIRAIAERPVTVEVERVPELRRIGEYSGSPGIALCALDDNARSPAFVFVSEGGELHETVIQGGSVENPTFQAIGSIPEWNPDVECQAHYAAGELVIGARTECNFIWQGIKGGPLTKTSLPYEMAAWSAVTARHLIGLDASGRLHSLRFDSGKMVQNAFLEGFIAASPNLACSYVDHPGHVFAFNGVDVEGVELSSDGQFGARVAPSLACKFDTQRIVTNRMGLCVAITKASLAVASGPAKVIALGATKPDARIAIAISSGRNIVAVIGTDLRLTAALLNGTDLIASGPSYSPILPDNPDSLLWSTRGEVLVVSFPDKTWALFKPFGMDGG